MELQEELVFKESKRPTLSLEIPEEEGDDKLTIGLKGQLTKSIAEALGVGYVFQSETVVHGGFRDMNLEADTKFSDVELRLSGENGELDTFFPESVYGFRCFKIGGGGLGVQCKIDLSGRLQELLDFFRKNRGEGFSFSIRSRQGNLFEGGTRVELASAAVAAEGSSDTVDRSYETRPRGGKRGRKVTPISEPEAAEPEPQSDDREIEALIN